MTGVSESLRGHVLLTGANGEISRPGEAAEAVDGMASAEHVVLHFHGGLVSQEHGLEVAASLRPVYERANAYPLFFVWQSDPLTILKGNLAEIAGEDAFKRLLRRLLRYAVGKLSDVAGARALGPALPPELAVDKELASPTDGMVPFAHVQPRQDIPTLDAEEERSLTLEILTDAPLEATLRGVVEARTPEPEQRTSKGVVAAVVSSEESLLDPAALDEIAPPTEATAKGLLSMTWVAKKAVRVLAHVVGRFRSGTDHGVYPTVVEELLREFYLANAGAILWNAMKKETADTFVRADPTRGGVLLLDRLAERTAQDRLPRVSLVGHSAGTVFINELLTEVERRRTQRDSALPEQFRFGHVVFLAPACTFTQFTGIVDRHEDLFGSFRMFTMDDASECADRLVPVLYPRSLLYFVSGLLERGADGRSDPGKPLVGLARFFDDEHGPERDDLRSVRRFVLGEEDRVVWSPSAGEPGFSAGATSHQAFDDDEQVRDSLVALLS